MFKVKKVMLTMLGIFVMSQLSGCGQSGPLYLPKQAQATQPAHVKAAKNNFDDHRLIAKD